jgi:hypothetical protein
MAIAWCSSQPISCPARHTLFRQQPNAESQGLREMVEEAAKHAPDRLLIVLDQFEEFVILAKPEQQQQFAAREADLAGKPTADQKVDGCGLMDVALMVINPSAAD